MPQTHLRHGIRRYRCAFAPIACLLLALSAHAGCGRPSPAEQTWRITVLTHQHHGGFSITPLGDGRLLLTGGRTPDYQPPHRMAIHVGERLRAVSIFDSQTNTFSAEDPMPEARSYHATTLLPDGRVLVTGGETAAKHAELYDPSQPRGRRWRQIAEAEAPHAYHRPLAILLDTGRVFRGFGVNFDSHRLPDATPPHALFDVHTERWTSLKAPSSSGTVHYHRGFAAPGGLYVTNSWAPQGTDVPHIGFIDGQTGKLTQRWTLARRDVQAYATARMGESEFLLIGGSQRGPVATVERIELTSGQHRVFALPYPLSWPQAAGLSTGDAWVIGRRERAGTFETVAALISRDDHFEPLEVAEALPMANGWLEVAVALADGGVLALFDDGQAWRFHPPESRRR